MSIINDALKKAQNRMSQETSATPVEGDESDKEKNGTEPKLGNERFSRTEQKKDHHQVNQAASRPPISKPHIKSKSSTQGAIRKPSKKILVLGVGLVLLLLVALGGLRFFNLIPFSGNYPTSRNHDKPNSSQGVKLSGIMTMGEKRVALINDEIYELGDIFEGLRIVEIERDKVHLSDQDQNITIIKVFGN